MLGSSVINSRDNGGRAKGVPYAMPPGTLPGHLGRRLRCSLLSIAVLTPRLPNNASLGDNSDTQLAVLSCHKDPLPGRSE